MTNPARVICAIGNYPINRNSHIEDFKNLLSKKQIVDMNNIIIISPTRVIYAKFRNFRRLVGSGKCEKLHNN